MTHDWLLLIGIALIVPLLWSGFSWLMDYWKARREYYKYLKDIGYSKDDDDLKFD